MNPVAGTVTRRTPAHHRSRFCLPAIRDQVVSPPSTTRRRTRPVIYRLPDSAREPESDVAVTDSFGFGSTEGTLILRRL